MSDDLELRETLKRLAGPPARRSGVWSAIEARAAAGRRSTSGAELWRAERSSAGRPAAGRSAATGRARRLGPRFATAAVIAVILMAGVTMVSFVGVRLLTRPDFVLRITDGGNGSAAGNDTAGAGGGTWERLPLPLEPGSVDSLVVDPDAPSTLFAKTSGGVYRSTDGGSSWTQTLSFSAIAGQTLAAEFDPAHPSTIYLLVIPRDGVAARLLRSDDGGVSWAEAAGKPPKPFGVWPPAIWFDTTRSPSIVYALGGSGVIRSADRGETWTELGPQEAQGEMDAKRRGPVLPAAADQALSHFFASFSGTVVDAATGIVVDVTAPGPGVEKATWAGSVAIDPADTSILYAATGAGVYKSADGGATWNSASAGLADAATRSVAPEPKDPATVYASTLSGIYRSGTGGAEWNRILDGEGSVVVAPSAPSRVYAWTSAGLYRSDNGGDTWLGLTAMGLTSWYSLEPDINGHPASGLVLVAADDPDVVFAVSSSRDQAGSSLFRSSDSGATWTEVLVGARFIVPDPKSASTLFATAGNRVFKSIDVGRTWTAVSPKGWDDAVVDIAINPLDPSVYVIQSSKSGEFSLQRSGDAGVTWEEVRVEVPAQSIRRVLLDIRNNGGLYVLTFDQVPGLVGGGLVRAGIYHSTDEGVSWENIGKGLPRAGYYSIALDPGSQTGLYVATATGLFKWVPNSR